MIRDLYYKRRGVLFYNVHFKDGSLANRVTERAICGLRPIDIDGSGMYRSVGGSLLMRFGSCAS